MSENERPALGSPEAAVRSMVNLIATAARVDEEQLAYWLDAYYQLRAAYEAEKGATADDCYCLLEQISDTLDAIRWPSRAPEPAEEAGKPSSGAARHLPPGEGITEPEPESKELPPAILKSSRVLPSADQAAIQSKKRTRSQEAAAADKSQRAYKMRVADRLRQVRANGVTTAQIVEAGHGSVPDGAVLGIVGGEFRPIADYRAIEAALDELETK